LSGNDQSTDSITNLVSDYITRFHLKIEPQEFKQLKENIASILSQLSNRPTLRNFIAAKITDKIPRNLAADITKLSIRQLDRGRDLSQKVDLSQLHLMVSYDLILFSTQKIAFPFL
jgi:hypothetical protein